MHHFVKALCAFWLRRYQIIFVMRNTAAWWLFFLMSHIGRRSMVVHVRFSLISRIAIARTALRAAGHKIYRRSRADDGKFNRHVIRRCAVARKHGRTGKTVARNASLPRYVRSRLAEIAAFLASDVQKHFLLFHYAFCGARVRYWHDVDILYT